MKRKKLTYYGKKCLIFLISVFILSVAVFYVARLAPGDPLISYYGDRTEKMSPEEREWAMEKPGNFGWQQTKCCDNESRGDHNAMACARKTGSRARDSF